MLTEVQFREIVSGRRRDLSARLLRPVLGAAGSVYAAAMRLRNLGYDRGYSAVHRPGAPVVSIGNLTLGGTGKTPLAAWTARWFRAQNVRVALVSRGYGAGASGVNDEALELEALLPDVPHVQDADRVAAARIAVEELYAQAILLDDGFQHRRLARDLDVVLLDAAAPFGYGRVFPRGLLREPTGGLRRADVVLLSRADMLAPPQRAELQAQVARLAPRAVWGELRHAPCALRTADGTLRPLADLQAARVAAFCGLGNPRGFEHTLAGCGCETLWFRAFPDHHAYTRADVQALHESVADLTRQGRVDFVLCTHKDLVKLQVDQLGGVPLAAVQIAVEFLAGESAYVQRLHTIAERAAAVVPADDDD